MILPHLIMPVLDELPHDISVSPDERHHVWIVGCLGHTDTLFDAGNLHTDLVGVTKHLPKQGIAQVYASPGLSTPSG